MAKEKTPQETFTNLIAKHIAKEWYREKRLPKELQMWALERRLLELDQEQLLVIKENPGAWGSLSPEKQQEAEKLLEDYTALERELDAAYANLMELSTMEQREQALADVRRSDEKKQGEGEEAPDV